MPLIGGDFSAARAFHAIITFFAVIISIVRPLAFPRLAEIAPAIQCVNEETNAILSERHSIKLNRVRISTWVAIQPLE